VLRFLRGELDAEYQDVATEHRFNKAVEIDCLTHHDQATAGLSPGQVGLGVKLTPNEVRAHKAAWEAAVATEIKMSKRTVPQRKRKQLEHS